MRPVIFMVDHDPTVRRAVHRLLTFAGHEVRTFATGHDFIAAYDGGVPGCLLLDQHLPDLSGLEVLDHLGGADSPLEIVFVSGQPDVATTVVAMKRGALDVLTKPFDEQTLLAVVASALERSASRWGERQEREALRRRFDTLTPRERQVCRFVASGYLNKQTAYELGTAEKTVKVHRARVMSKLEVGSVPELVRLVDRLASWRPGTFAPLQASTARASVA